MATAAHLLNAIKLFFFFEGVFIHILRACQFHLSFEFFTIWVRTNLQKQAVACRINLQLKLEICIHKPVLTMKHSVQKLSQSYSS